MKAKAEPKKQWSLSNGGRGQAGPGRPRKLKVHPLDPGYFDEARKRQAAGFTVDWSQKISRAVLELNPEATYLGLAKRFAKGNSRRAGTMLLNRAYGKPARNRPARALTPSTR